MKRSPRVLDTANKREVGRSQWGQFTYGPAVDGTYVRDLPGRELLHGNFVKNITILQGHNEYPRCDYRADSRDEGLIFVDPTLLIASERQTRMKLRQNLPLASLSTLRQMQKMYPSPSLSNGEYAHQFDRVNAMISRTHPPTTPLTTEWIFNCNTRYISQAYDNNTYNYRYSIRPSIHAADVFLTFMDLKFDWRGKRQMMRLPYAQAWQSYLIGFIKYGDPNVLRRAETIEWGVTGEEMRIVDLRWEGFQWSVDDQVDAERCGFWQRGEYAPLWNVSS